MIELLKGISSSSYTVINEQIKTRPAEEKTEDIFVDIHKLLDEFKSCTYTSGDENNMSQKSMEELKSEWEINKDGMEELYKQGIDIESLNMEELSYYVHSAGTGEKSSHIGSYAETEDKSLEEKVEVIKGQNSNMYLYTLTSNSPVTINSLYENNFKGEFKKGLSHYTREDVSQVLSMNGLSQSESNIWAADLLMMYDMGVNGAQISKLQNIQSAVSALDYQYSGFSADDELIKDEQVQYEPEYIERITDDLGMVTDEHIEKLIEEGSEISIGGLRDSIHKNASEALRDKSLQDYQGEGGRFNEETVYEVATVKKQIHQIRTKLTAEAAQKISSQMPLESAQLSQVVNALNEMEQEMAISALKQADLEVTEENTAAIAGVMNVVHAMKGQFTETVQIQVETSETAKLSEIQTALKVYGENETPVEKRFGESIEKVESQIGNLLTAKGIEATQTHIEAAKALITNQMEVNEKNLENIEHIVMKLNTFLEEMTPVQAASLMKEGVNLLEASVDQILNFVSDKKISGLKNSIAETIIELEKSGEVSEEQKEGLIGLYRILQAVTRQKEEVMGYLYKNELPLTLENLQMAVVYAGGKKRIDKTVDDSSGEIQELIYNRQTAKQLMEDSRESSQRTLEIIKYLENMALPVTEESMDKLTKMNALLYPYIKEQFKKSLGRFDGMSSLPDSFLEKIETVQNVSQELINQMQEEDVPLTLSNIFWMDKVTKEPNLYGKLLEENGFLKEELPQDLEELEEELMRLEEMVKEQKEESTLTGEVGTYRSCKQIEELVQFQRQRIENEGLYQIPFIIEGERKLINLYMKKDDSGSSVINPEHLKAVITYETKSLGVVKASIEIKGDNIGYKIEADAKENKTALEMQGEKLIERIKSIGYNVQYTAFESEYEEDNELSKENKYYDSSLFEEII